MVSAKSARNTIVAILIVLVVLSVALKLYSGIQLNAAVLDTLMSSLEINYVGLTLKAAALPGVIASKAIDTVIPPLLAVLLASIFVEAISGFDVGERMARSRIRKMDGHVILTPYNAVSRSLAENLKGEGMDVAIIVKTRKELAEISSKGIPAMMGDIESFQSFEDAGVSRASYLIACSEDDATNALIALTAKAKGSGLRIIALVNSKENADKMASIGVERSIMPEVMAGEDLAEKIIKRLYSPTALAKE